MNPAYKTSPDLAAYGFAIMLALLLLQRFGKGAAAWVLNKLYEFFIQNNPVKI
ncbi:MAG: hypothetical protein WAT19_00495 [Ferruginibacter sp.]